MLRFQYNGDLGARFHAWRITELPANFPWRRLKSKEVLGPASAFIKSHTGAQGRGGHGTPMDVPGMCVIKTSLEYTFLGIHHGRA